MPVENSGNMMQGGPKIRTYRTGFHTPQPRAVNCPSDGAIVTVMSRADVANPLSMISPPFDVRSQ